MVAADFGATTFGDAALGDAAYAAAGGAVILSSHLLDLVEELCDRILVIQKGQLVFAGTMSEIKDHRPDLEGEGLEDVFLALTEGDP